MTIESITQIAATAVSIIGAIVGFIKPMITKVITQMETQFAELRKDNAEMRKDFMDFRLQVVNDYARIPHIEQVERANTASHATMHSRIDEINNKVIRIETVQAQCKGCNNKV